MCWQADAYDWLDAAATRRVIADASPLHYFMYDKRYIGGLSRVTNLSHSILWYEAGECKLPFFTLFSPLSFLVAGLPAQFSLYRVSS